MVTIDAAVVSVNISAIKSITETLPIPSTTDIQIVYTFEWLFGRYFPTLKLI